MGYLSILSLFLTDNTRSYRNTDTVMPTLTFKVSPAEARTIRSRARQQKATVSTYLRARALGTLQKSRSRMVIKRHSLSGLAHDATPGPVVTQAQIDAAIADFP